MYIERHNLSESEYAGNGTDIPDSTATYELRQPRVIGEGQTRVRFSFDVDATLRLFPDVEPKPRVTRRSVRPSVEKEFYSIYAEWRERTRHLSLFEKKFTDLAYGQLIGMGEEILPLVFRELERTTSDWFWLLSCIARDKAPVISVEDSGRVRKIAAIWMQWGRDNGYVSV